MSVCPSLSLRTYGSLYHMDEIILPIWVAVAKLPSLLPRSIRSRLDFRWRRQPRVDEHADRPGAAVRRRRGLRGHLRRGQRALLHAVGAQQLADQGNLLHRAEDLRLDRARLLRLGRLVEQFQPMRSHRISCTVVYVLYWMHKDDDSHCWDKFPKPSSLH